MLIYLPCEQELWLRHGPTHTNIIARANERP
jgi:hypothetical protein